MSAAAERVTFAAIAADLVALRGAADERRAAGLLPLSDDSPTADFVDLLSAPAWLRWPREAQTRLAHAAALRSIAPLLAGSIDGAWLGALAVVAGEETLDWAIGWGEDIPCLSDAAIAPDTLAAHGFATMRAALPPGLRAYLEWAPLGASATANSLALADALAFVSERTA